MKRTATFLAVLVLAGCANKPLPPEWLLTADSAINSHAQLWLEGRDKLATRQLAVAREAVSRTGDASQQARIELHACAVRLASLQGGQCPAFLPLARDAGQAENAYAGYLAGQLATTDTQFLPENQRQAWQNPQSLKDIKDPLALLVAAAALLEAGRLPPENISLAIETAAGQGWRRALLAWLSLEKERLHQAGDQTGSEAIERRIERVLGDSR
jgi:hypothetical protein